MIDRRPALVVRPADARDVAAAIGFAREHGLLVAVKAGGHSIPGFSTCDDGLVVDLSLIRGARVDAEERTARVGGGALLAELDDAAQAHGLVCPVGVVSHTGVAGLTLGGGMGRLQRKLGLTVDSLAAVELVTADGRLVRASEDEHPDLFWGLRGAGANFGIATAFEFRLHPLEHPVTHGAVVYPVERARELAECFRELVDTGPDELWASFGLGLAVPRQSFPAEIAGRAVATVSVLHCGPPADAARDLALLQRAGEPVLDSVQAKPYLSAQHIDDEAMEWGHRFYMKSVFLPELPDELVDAWAQHVSGVPAGADGGFSVWSWGRAIAAVGEDETAFTGRGAAFWAAAEVQWDGSELDDSCRAWTRAAMEPAAPHASAGRYVNDVADVERGLARSIYGEAKYERLVGLKRSWDPDNVFRLNQNIQP